jgi:hypothetical protein
MHLGHAAIADKHDSQITKGRRAKSGCIAEQAF